MWIVSLLFLPAFALLLVRAILGPVLPQHLLALALGLQCLEQARMARVDLQQVAMVSRQCQDARLKQFHQLTVITIGLELVGFYAAIQWPGGGALLVLISQVFFNACAEIQLDPSATEVIRPWDVVQRWPVLAANGVGLGLVGLWMAGMGQLWVASGLLGLVLLYGLVKYGRPSRF
jgi:hypothetical protein